MNFSLLGGRNEKGIDLKSIANELSIMVLNDEIQRWRKELLYFYHCFLVSSNISQDQGSSLEKNVNVIWALVYLIAGDILDEFGQNLSELLTKVNDLMFGDLDCSIESPDGIEISIFIQKLAKIGQKSGNNIILNILTRDNRLILHILLHQEFFDTGCSI